MKNVILIGMPGCGKSTVGVVLAKILGFRFLDSDIVIQEQEHRLLSEIIAQEGLDRFNDIENRVNSSLEIEKTVVATGGSVVYGRQAMEHLKQIGVVVYIRLPFEEIEERLGDFAQRGVSIRREQTLRELYDERVPLYEQYADIIIDEHDLTVSKTALAIAQQLKQGGHRNRYTI